MIRSYPAVSLGEDKFSQAVLAYLPVCKHPAKILLSVNICFTLYFNFGLEGANCMSLNPCVFNLETSFLSATEDTAKDRREELLTARQMKCVTVIYACPKEAQIWMPEETGFWACRKSLHQTCKKQVEQKLIREINVMVQGRKAEYVKSNERWWWWQRQQLMDNSGKERNKTQDVMNRKKLKRRNDEKPIKEGNGRWKRVWVEDMTKESRRDYWFKAEDYSAWHHLQHSRNYLYGLEVDELVHQ